MGLGTPITSKVLLALAYWKGDKEHAAALARHLANLEPGHSARADFLLVNRFDCPRDPMLVAELSRKFNVYQWTSTRRSVGWPDGCNALALSMFDWVWSMLTYRKVPRYRAVLNMEADCAPLTRDWLTTLIAAWDEANASGPVCVAGPLVDTPREHINANAWYGTNPEFLTWLTRKVSLAGGGWDFVLADQFRQRGWANIPAMRSLWNTSHFSDGDFETLRADGAVWVHGDKSGDLLELSKLKL